jgi:hypothetical protein
MISVDDERRDEQGIARQRVVVQKAFCPMRRLARKEQVDAKETRSSERGRIDLRIPKGLGQLVCPDLTWRGTVDSAVGKDTARGA